MRKEIKIGNRVITPAMVQAHADVVSACHFPIADNSENRKRLEKHICSVCAKIKCTGRGRCRATATTMAGLNLLTGIVVFRDEGSPELGIEGFDRVITIGEALRPFNPILAEYFDEEGIQELHVLICLSSKEGETSLGRLVIPEDYNIKVNKVYDRE